MASGDIVRIGGGDLKGKIPYSYRPSEAYQANELILDITGSGILVSVHVPNSTHFKIWVDGNLVVPHDGGTGVGRIGIGSVVFNFPFKTSLKIYTNNASGPFVTYLLD